MSSRRTMSTDKLDDHKSKTVLPTHNVDAGAIDGEVIDKDDAMRYANAVVPLTDDPSIPTFTLRAVVLGILFGTFVGIVNAIFSFRTNAIYIPSGFYILLSLPIGVFLSKVLPTGTILNPGPFSIKEHIIVYIIAGAASGAPYGIDNVVGQKYFLKDSGATFWPSLLFVICTQFAGYGLSGLTRRFLVRPAAMFWPGNMPDIALFRSLHETEKEQIKSKSVGGLSRYAMFWLVFVFIFIWTFVPQYFASSLQLISLLCFFSKSNLASMLGSGNTYEGFGILTLNFDWAITTNSGPLSSPFYATLVNTLGYMFFFWILSPIFQFTNPFGAPFLPNSNGLVYHDNTTAPAINEPSLFSNNGTRISAPDLLKDDLTLDETAYGQLSPIYITNQFAIEYLSSFFVLSSMLSHVALWYGKDLWKQTKEALRQVRQDEGDVHAELMKAYPDVPDWVYLAFAVVMLLVQILVCQFTVYKLEWWGVIFGFVLAFLFLIPVGIIQALTGVQVGLNVLTEFIMGLMLPGQFVQVVTFKSYAYNMLIQALFLTSSLKFGHYMHINPVYMVASQFLGTLIGALTNTGAAFFAMDNLADLLENNPDWTPIGYITFVNAGAIWGAIGPARFFGTGSPYSTILWGFLIGLVLPLFPWLGNRFFPSKNWHYVNIPVFLYVGATGTNTSWLLPGLVIAFIFQYYIFNYHYEWWAKYTYCISSALDTGTNIAVLLISLLLTLHIQPAPSTLNPDLTYDPYCFSP